MSNLSDSSTPTPEGNLQSGVHYKQGDVIGQKYEVYGVLGKGGCGVVYLVYSLELGDVYALKTFKDEFLSDQEVRKRFQKEASIWVELGHHPYLVNARFVEEISGRLYLAMEYIAPNEEGLNSLDGYLRRGPPDLAQSLGWGVQVCRGMEYAYSKGVRAHRDLKPANVMIAQDKTVRITDFGLAGVLSQSLGVRATGLDASRLSGQTMLGTGFGTPTHMAPEQFDNATACDERSDIYSFGIVLYQMATGGRLPFPIPMGADWQRMWQLHRESPVPRLESPLFPIIQRCLEKSPENRYQTFKELRSDLEPMLQHQTGKVVIPPQLKELETWEWTNKGGSLHHLGRNEEAIRCYDKALDMDPRIAHAWNGKGSSLSSLGRYEEAIRCFDKALELSPRHVNACTNKATSLGGLGHYEEAFRCLDKALELDPQLAFIWFNKGTILGGLGRYEEENLCYDKSLELDSHFLPAWTNKGASLNSLGRYEEAIRCFDKALELDPCQVEAWTNKGASLSKLGRFKDAACCLDRVLELAPRLAVAWMNKGIIQNSLGQRGDAIISFNRALELDPRDVHAWSGKGASLIGLGCYEAAIHCCDEALALDLHYVNAWYDKGVSLHRLGRNEDAIHCYAEALGIDPRDVRFWKGKAACLSSLRRYEEAIHCCDEALVLDSRDASAWTDKGISLHRLGRNEDAIRCYDKALEIDQRIADAWFLRAFAEDELRQWGEAARSYRQFIALAPTQFPRQVEHARGRLRELGGG